MSNETSVPSRAAADSREGFSLLGGPLYRLGCRLGLVRGGTNTTRMGLVLGAFLWLILAGLALIPESTLRVFSLSVVAIHIRLLVVIPLFFVCESFLDPRVSAFVGMVTGSGIVSERARPRLDALIARLMRLTNSWIPDVVCLIVAVVISASSSWLPLAGRSGAFDPEHVVEGAVLAGSWYWFVCLPFFRFLLVRWIWRIAVWSRFLIGVSRLELELVPTHPDGVAGLGYLQVVHAHFTPLVFAISTLQSASIAEGLSTGTTQFESIYPALAAVAAVDAALFLLPLFAFTPQLWACRVEGLRYYMEFAERYVRGFDTKWLRAGAPPEEPLLGTPDLQSLADLNNSISVVRSLRLVPISYTLLAPLAFAAVVPLLPLLLFEYPLADLLRKLVTTLIGL